MLLSGGDFARRDAVVDLSGGDAEQAGGFSDRYPLPVSLVGAGNIMFITDPSDTGICKWFSFWSSQPVLV